MTDLRDGQGRDGSVELAFFAMVSVLLARRRTIVLSALALFVAVVGWTVIQPRTYTASTTFLPDAGAQGANRLAGLAAQFGVAVGGATLTSTPEYYAQLVSSNDLLTALVGTQYDVKEQRLFGREARRRRGTLPELWNVDREGRTDEELALTVRLLRERMSVSAGAISRTVTVSIRTASPDLSAALVGRVVALMQEFNLHQRQSQATAERAFVESRVERVQAELRSAESAMERYLVANRQWELSPALRFEHDRLAREVVLRQQILSALLQSFEQARIEEVRDTPVFTIVDQPRLPALPDRRYLLLKGLIALTVGSFLGIVLALLAEAIASARGANNVRVAQLDALITETLADLRRPWRIFRRRQLS